MMKKILVPRDATRMVILFSAILFILGLLIGFMWSEVRSVKRYNQDMQSLEDSVEFDP